MPDIWEVASIIVKLALYLGIIGSVGLTMISISFAELVAPLNALIRSLTVGLAGLAVFATLLSFMLRGAALTGGGDGMIDPEMLGLLWTTQVGDVLVFRLLGITMILVGQFVPRIGQWIALVGGTLALWSFTQIGHVPQIEQAGVRFLLLLHLLGISFWVGVLGPLRELSRDPDSHQRAALLGHRFGQTALLIVPISIIAGVLMAWLILGNISALFTTGYGLALLAKMALVGLVLIMAAVNKLRFVPAVQSGDPLAARHLARSIEIETLLILVVLGATATLTSILPLPN